VRRRKHECVEDALLPFGDECARQSEQRGEHDRDPEQTEPGKPPAPRGQREVEDDERGDDEEHHRRQRVACTHLEQQILAGECPDVRGVTPHANASLCVESEASRWWSCVATTYVPSCAASSRSRSSAPSASSALYGSSSNSSDG